MNVRSLPKNLCNAAVNHFTAGLVPRCIRGVEKTKEKYSEVTEDLIMETTDYDWLNITLIVLAVIYFIVMVGLWIRFVVYAYRSSGLEALSAFFFYNLYVIYKLANLIDFNTKNTS